MFYNKRQYATHTLLVQESSLKGISAAGVEDKPKKVTNKFVVLRLESRRVSEHNGNHATEHITS